MEMERRVARLERESRRWRMVSSIAALGVAFVVGGAMRQPEAAPTEEQHQAKLNLLKMQQEAAEKTADRWPIVTCPISKDGAALVITPDGEGRLVYSNGSIASVDFQPSSLFGEPMRDRAYNF